MQGVQLLLFFHIQLPISNTTTPFPKLAAEEKYSCVGSALKLSVPLVQSGGHTYCNFTASNVRIHTQQTSKMKAYTAYT